MDRVQVEILGLSTNQTSNNSYALILKESNGPRRLPILIGAPEASSIALEMEGIKPPRPLTHDLLKNIIDTLGSTLTEIEITELRDATFYAKLHLDASGIEIDSRPSDAIALAVRFSAPIYVAESVMEEASFLPEGEDDPEAEGEDEPERPFAAAREILPESVERPQGATKLEVLRQQLAEAISREEYEAAARIRDEIVKLGVREG